MDVNAEYLRRRKRASGKNAVLTEERVARIKRLLLAGMMPQELAEANGVGTETIRRIGREETWGWVQPEPDPAQQPQPVIADETIEASQERLLRLLQNDTPATGKSLLDKALEEANKIRNPAGLDKFIGDGKG